MPPLNLPPIRHTDATRSLTGRPFVLRLGRANRPILTAKGDNGKPVHVPLHYDEVSDTYSVGAPGLFLGKASKLRDLFDRAIPAEALQETLERILRGTNPNIIVNVR